MVGPVRLLLFKQSRKKVRARLKQKKASWFFDMIHLLLGEIVVDAKIQTPVLSLCPSCASYVAIIVKTVYYLNTKYLLKRYGV